MMRDQYKSLCLLRTHKFIEAPIVSASVIGGSEAKVKGGIIDG